MANLRLALRMLARTPFVTGVAVASLAFGIGANAAIFSLFDHMLCGPLPVASPEQLVNLSAPGPKPGSQSCGNAGPCDDVFSYAMFRDLEKAQEPFVSLAAHVSFGTNLAYRGQTMTGDGMLVSGSYFPTLGIQAMVGRLFTAEDDRDGRQPLRRGSQRDVLAHAVRVEPASGERHADGQRSAHVDHRHRAAGDSPAPPWARSRMSSCP